MAEEFIQNNYFNSTNIKWVDIHRSNKISIEAWLTKLLFHDDLSRVVYATPDIAFRKRIEMLDQGKDDEAPLKPEMLNLPFASFSMSGDPEPDDRMAAVNATESVTGLYYEEEDRLMRTIAVKTKYKIICYFSRLDDVRMAHQLLFQEMIPKHPIWMYNTVKWRNININLPTFVTLESINTTPEYKERDWLTKNRIFPIEIELTSRSYMLTINNVDKIIQLPMRFASYKDEFEEDEYVEILTEEVALTWAAQKFGMDIDKSGIDKDDEEYKLFSPYFVHQDMSEEELIEGVAIPSHYMTDTVRAYWQEDTTCILSAYKYDPVKSTSDTARIALKVKPSTFKYFDHMELYIPTKKPVIVNDCHATEAYIEGLYPNSDYKLTITLYAIDGTLQRYYLRFTTKNDPANKAPQPTDIGSILVENTTPVVDEALINQRHQDVEEDEEGKPDTEGSKNQEGSGNDEGSGNEEPSANPKPDKPSDGGSGSNPSIPSYDPEGSYNDEGSINDEESYNNDSSSSYSGETQIIAPGLIGMRF